MKKFLNPESVALVGVPRNTGTGSYNNLEILLRFGYQGEIYPINPKAAEICGKRCYSSVLEIPKTVDLAVIAIGRDRVPKVFDQCCKRGIKRVLIISQGFADGDGKGKRLQDELLVKAKEEGVRIIGPNTLGVYNVRKGFTTGFVDHHKPPNPDPVCMIAQTGVYQAGAMVFSQNGFAKAVDLGNACDLDIVDALEYLENDPETKVIAVHMEGIKRGREFIEVARRVGRKKPIIILKTGRSSAGAKAAISHTGSLVGNTQVFDAAFKKAGVIQVRTNSELQDAIKAFVNFPSMNGNRLAVITATGALGIIATDASEDYGLELGSVPPLLSKEILRGLPHWVHLSNPIDIWPIGMISGRMPQVFESALAEVLDSENIHAVAIVWVSFKSPLHADIDFYEITARVQKERSGKKPVAFWFYGDTVEKAIHDYEKVPGVACFPTIERAVRGLAFNYQYAKIRNKPEGKVFDNRVDRVVGHSLINRGKRQKILIGTDAFSLLEAYGIPVAPVQYVDTLDDAMRAADTITYPVVCKVSQREFLHKTEMNAVTLNIMNEDELEAAYNGLMKLLESKDIPGSRRGIIVQKQLRGHELLLGLKRDLHFGMVAVCGQGGIYTEVYNDISQSITPVTLEEAHEMLSTLKIYPILKGVRKEKGIDLDLPASMICRLSVLSEEAEGLSEVDINPLIVNHDGCWAVDARFLWE